MKFVRFTAKVAINTALIAAMFVVGSLIARWLGAIYSISLGFLVIAIAVVFVAVFSKAYRNWPA